jgi:creatinine amidohydrolase/Fe(II)-dependent formamide hydrolase-like protein
MRLSAIALAAAFAAGACAQNVDFEMMTWPEVKQAIEAGKTTALVYNGGTEQRGPQAVNGGHTLMGHATVLAIAEKLGNAIAAPVLPFSVNNASAALPGTIGLTGPLFAAINEQVAEQLILDGFHAVVLMGDHGGGQKELAEVARKLNAKYAPRHRVVYCGDVYEKANADFDKWLAANGYPISTHAGIPDTSEMLYLGGDKGWVRKDLIPNAVGGRGAANGIHGDARRSTAELGKRFFDLKVDYAVRQIRELLR